jgi:hypothetical protein
MRRLHTYTLVASLGLSLALAPAAQAKPKIVKPSAPSIAAISSSVPKKGKVNVTVTISLPASNGGSTITGSKVSAGGKSCTIKKLKTSCTIKGIKNGKSLSVTASSKNKKGFGSKSTRVSYRAGGTAYANGTSAPTSSTGAIGAPIGNINNGAASRSPLIFNTKNATGVALTASTQNFRGLRSLVSSSQSNLIVTDSSGVVSDGLASGSASISRFMVAPNGDLFVVFQTPTMLVPGGSSCLLASVAKSTGIPICIDDTLQSINWDRFNRNDAPIQFDSSGGIYYSGYASNGKTILRMFKDGQTTNLINDNIGIGRFIVIPSGGVIVSGTTTSTNANWVRKISPNGGLRTLESTSAQSFGKFADGNIYYGVWGPSDFGIKRYLVSSDDMDSQYWISGDVNGVNRQTRNNVSDICSYGSSQPTNEGFCGYYGTIYQSAHSPIGGKTYIVAGSSGQNAMLTQVFPSLATPQISIKKVSIALTLGGGIALTGLNSSNQNSLIYYNTESGAETTLISSTNEIEIYHLTYNAATNKLMFDGLRFADNKFIFGQVDLGTNELNVFTTLNSKWEDFQGFQ